MTSRLPARHIISKLPSFTYWIVIAFSLLSHWWFLSEGTWRPLGSAFKGISFDDMALNLVKSGAPSVACSILANEALKVGETCFMYFGPWPSLLRIPALLLAPHLQGLLSRPSCILASTLCIAALALLFSSSRRRAPIFTATMLAGATLGTPVMFLTNSSALFHESILWGHAAVCWCILGCLRAINPNYHQSRWLGIASLATAIAIISRITFGIASCGTLVLVTGHLIFERQLSLRRAIALCSPVFISVLLHAWYNYARFGSVLASVGGSGYEIDVAMRVGLFDPARIWEHLRFYFEPISSHFTPQYPYIRMSMRPYTNPELYHSWREPLLPLTLASPWLIASSIPAIMLLLQKRRWLHVSIVVFLVGCWLPMLMHLFSTHRYSAELLPAQFFTLAAALEDDHSPLYKRPAALFISALIVISLFTTIGTMSCWTGYWVGTMWFSSTFRALMQTVIPVCAPVA